MSSNPAAAAEMARSMAEALAATGNFFPNYFFFQNFQHYFFWKLNYFL